MIHQPLSNYKRKTQSRPKINVVTYLTLIYHLGALDTVDLKALKT